MNSEDKDAWAQKLGEGIVVAVFMAAAMFVIFLLAGVVGCTNIPVATPPTPVPTATPIATPTPAPVATPAPVNAVVLSWEAGHTERAAWSKQLLSTIGDTFSVLSKAPDMKTFCPKFGTLNATDQKTAFAELFVAMSFYESAWNPTLRYLETTMDEDDVTKQQVQSEGLLQLSYGDTEWAPFCKFDWSKDKTLSGTDPKKTIFDPLLNLDCGVRILVQQVENHGALIVSQDVTYWAVITKNGHYQQINNIAGRVQKALPACKAAQ